MSELIPPLRTTQRNILMDMAAHFNRTSAPYKLRKPSNQHLSVYLRAAQRLVTLELVQINRNNSDDWSQWDLYLLVDPSKVIPCKSELANFR